MSKSIPTVSMCKQQTAECAFAHWQIPLFSANNWDRLKITNVIRNSWKLLCHFVYISTVWLFVKSFVEMAYIF